jgi:hypothetical protein
MAGAAFVVVAVVVVAAVALIGAATLLRRRDVPATATTGDAPGARRSLPRHVTLEDLSLPAPSPGRALVVLFSTRDCSACMPARRRLDRLAEADVVEFDLTDGPDAATELGIDGVPALLVYGADGVLVRSWIGEPLAGTLERAVRTAASVTD